jgi:hypothetical protein
MVLDADLLVRYVSDSCENVFGFRQDEPNGRGLEVFGTDALETLNEALGRCGVVDADTQPVAWKLTDPSGRTRCAESTITNLLADSAVGGFVLNTRDETDRVALEVQMRDQALHDSLTGCRIVRCWATRPCRHLTIAEGSKRTSSSRSSGASAVTSCRAICSAVRNRARRPS